MRGSKPIWTNRPPSQTENALFAGPEENETTAMCSTPLPDFSIQKMGWGPIPQKLFTPAETELPSLPGNRALQLPLAFFNIEHWTWRKYVWMGCPHEARTHSHYATNKSCNAVISGNYYFFATSIDTFVCLLSSQDPKSFDKGCRWIGESIQCKPPELPVKSPRSTSHPRRHLWEVAAIGGGLHHHQR